MESDSEDVKRLTQLISVQKQSNYQSNFQVEFQDFIAFRSENEDDDFYLEEDENTEEENDVKNFFKSDLSLQVSTSALTEDERLVIDSCTDADLKRLLILNRLKNMQLIKLHKKILDLLNEVEESMQEKDVIIKNLEVKQLYRQQANVWKLAAPYFKDKKYYQCPLNEDAKRKRANKELTIYDLNPSLKWTTMEINRLINAVKCSYNINRQNDIVQRINALKCEEYIDIKEIRKLEEELQNVKVDDKVPPLNSNEFISWNKVSETFLKDKHTPYECQSVWHLLVHPDINKSEWSEQENHALQVIAKRYSYQNWDSIAFELNTKRTGFMVCLNYFSKLCDKFKKNKFSQEEDRLLLEVINSCKIGEHIPWHKVVYHFDNRSRHQLYHRYTYFLSQNHVKKGKFTEAEDILLLILVAKFGRNFRKCAEYMPHRSQVQLKSRYISNLQRDIKKGTFTVEDDQIIMDYVKKHGEKNWSGLTVKLNRCNAQIRQRYRLIKQYFDANPDGRLQDVPKRKHNFIKGYEDQYSFLNYVAEQYKDSDCIPTLAMIEESLQMELENPQPERVKPIKQNRKEKEATFKNIDAMLTDFFIESSKAKQDSANDMNFAEACNNVEEVLLLLGAELTIPEVFEYDINLDNIDVEILEKLSISRSHNSVDTLVTPNISTLVGLRNLIIKHKDYKAEQKNKNLPSTSKSDKIVWSMEQNLLKLSDQTKKEVLHHRELFTRRFNSLFNWSAVLSLERPNIEKTATPAVKSYARRSTDSTDGQVTKRRKIDSTTVNDFKTQPNKLQVVDKSVVEKLMKCKNNVNIIQLATLKDSKRIIKPMLENNDMEISEPDLIDTESTEDVKDVQKLNILLKSKALNDSQTYTNDEYKAIQGDVKLLKEILQYEKIKVEPDTED